MNNFIVTNKLNNFGALILKFESPYQERILSSIYCGYEEATGYNGCDNYDIFTDISFYVGKFTKDIGIKKRALDILEGCSKYRGYAQRKLLEVRGE